MSATVVYLARDQGPRGDLYFVLGPVNLNEGSANLSSAAVFTSTLAHSSRREVFSIVKFLCKISNLCFLFYASVSVSNLIIMRSQNVNKFECLYRSRPATSTIKGT